MSERPDIRTLADSTEFREYYYLKEELVSFCREKGLPVSGGKPELTERIARFLDSGEIPDVKKPHKASGKPASDGGFSSDSIIGENVVCSEKLREFFRREIGDSFSFGVPFQKWLRANPDKTLGEAVAAYREIKKDKNKTDIDKQFEYNTYIRDFFADNKGLTLNDAIKCWKYKKSLRGHNRYERSDLSALNGGDPGKERK